MRKIVAISLIIVSLFALAPASLAAVPSFPDITDSRTERDVAALRMLGVIDGDGGRFYPDATLTRAAFCKMAVIVMGRASEEPQYRSRTVFPDVRASHWARGYVNLAATGENRIINGNSDGTFKPDEDITFAQSVTILLNMLGYKADEIGLLWPSDHLRFASSAGLTEGLGFDANAPITRKAAARLFVNLLLTEKKDGGKYGALHGSMTDDVIVLDVDAKASDGSTGAIRTTAGSDALKAKNGLVPDTFLGMRGTLVTDKGQAVTFLPSSGKSVTFIADSTNAAWIKSMDGKQYDIPKSATVYTPDGEGTLETMFVDIPSGTQVTVYYNNDAIDAVYIDLRQSSGALVVMPNSVSRGYFTTLTGGDTGYKIFKNGLETTFSGISKYDVATYNKSSKILSVSDFRVSACYEYVYPNTEYPSSVTLFGREFPVLPSAVESLSGFKLGEVATFLMTADYQIAAAFRPQEVQGAPLGVVEAVSQTTATVRLLSGMTLEGNPQLTEKQASEMLGQLVTVTAPKTNCIYLGKVGSTGGYGHPADLNEMTFGSMKISPDVRLFDKIGTSAVTPVPRSELVLGVIPENRILYLGVNSSGKIDTIILNNVTGDLYNYGFLTVGEDENNPTLKTVSVRNSGGTTGPLRTMQKTDDIPYGAVGGVAVTAGGARAASIITLTRADNIRRAGFKTVGDRMYVSIKGEDFPVADNVQCYNKATGGWFETLAEARAFSDSLTVYYDKPTADNGKIRFVVAG